MQSYLFLGSTQKPSFLSTSSGLQNTLCTSVSDGMCGICREGTSVHELVLL